MLGGERRDGGGSPYLLAARDGNHDGGLLLTLRRRLDGETAAAPDGREDVEEVDGEHRVEEHLAVTLRHAMPLQPPIDNQEVFDLHRETRRLPDGGFASVALALPNRDVGQSFELAGANLDGRNRLLYQRLSIRMTLLGQVSRH